LIPQEVFTSYGNVSPSGQKVTIAFEELKAAYPNLSKELDYSIHSLNFKVNEQKSDWYLKVRSYASQWLHRLSHVSYCTANTERGLHLG
jgi:hypothetical protein